MVMNVLLNGQLMWNTPLLVGMIGIAVIYSLFVHRFTEIKLYQKQPLFFYLSLGLLCVSIGSPLTTISHLSFSLHMIQMSILYFIIPPILLIGTPSNLFQRIRETPIANVVSKWFLSPRIALFVFAILFFMYHLPVVLNVFSQNSFLHNGYIFVLLILSFSMWWPIVSPDPRQRFKKEEKNRFAFLSGVLLMPACLLFVFSALIDGSNNPFLTQLTAHLCIPSQSQSFSLNILPTPFNTKYDQAIAGFIILGIHKISLMATARLDSKSDTQVEKVCL
ncbi:cytochrome c oxidase assembly protein [Bacillus sp. Marseille-P3661]|uniref:cytochrome c oxidase assembly protein n=1 Tax=Bacillus sp. Marseille-P3661 TaxID=1936234 RepID=UPI000C8631AF|nr:cytochrome c oxidase assembly protein [Bacillus sp. Marseille-P3661]